MILFSGCPPWPPDHPRARPRTATPTPHQGAQRHAFGPSLGSIESRKKADFIGRELTPTPDMKVEMRHRPGLAGFCRFLLWLRLSDHRAGYLSTGRVMLERCFVMTGALATSALTLGHLEKLTFSERAIWMEG